ITKPLISKALRTLPMYRQTRLTSSRHGDAACTNWRRSCSRTERWLLQSVLACPIGFSKCQETFMTRNLLITAMLGFSLAQASLVIAQGAPAAPSGAAGSDKEPVVEDFKLSSLNQPNEQYPQVNSQRRVRTRVV